MSIEDALNQEWDLVALPGGMPGKTPREANFLQKTEVFTNNWKF